MASDFGGGSRYDRDDVVRKCQHVEYVSDDDAWDEVWGPPDVHESPCGKPATVIVTYVCICGVDEFAFCAAHAPTPCDMIRDNGVPCGLPATTIVQSGTKTYYFCADCAKWGL